METRKSGRYVLPIALPLGSPPALVSQAPGHVFLGPRVSAVAPTWSHLCSGSPMPLTQGTDGSAREDASFSLPVRTLDPNHGLMVILSMRSGWRAGPLHNPRHPWGGTKHGAHSTARTLSSSAGLCRGKKQLFSREGAFGRAAQDAG